MQAIKNSMMMPALLLLGAALAVRPAQAAIGIGPLAGANISNADINGHTTSSIAGWAVGGRVEMGLNPLFGLLFDPQLVQSGSNFDVTGSTRKPRFILAEVPLLLDIHLSALNMGVYGFAGPDLIFVTHASGNVGAIDDLQDGDAKALALAGQIGAGLAFGVTPFMAVTADARYVHGFTDLLNGAKGDLENWRNRDVLLNVGVVFHSPSLSVLGGGGQAF